MSDLGETIIQTEDFKRTKKTQRDRPKAYVVLPVLRRRTSVAYGNERAAMRIVNMQFGAMKAHASWWITTRSSYGEKMDEGRLKRRTLLLLPLLLRWRATANVLRCCWWRTMIECNKFVHESPRPALGRDRSAPFFVHLLMPPRYVGCSGVSRNPRGCDTPGGAAARRAMLREGAVFCGRRETLSHTSWRISEERYNPRQR